MSTTIDSRVVEMRFDNRHFENNVSTTMSTLDKLKQKLNLKGAASSLDDVNRAASKIDMSGLGSAVQTVSAKFSALEVMGVTALANITNSAINAGKRLVSSLSVDQITSGWSKYEQKTASVQTIMNSTGKSIEEVNGYLDKLMRFSDETSYGFTDMTAALAQMTSSGGDIKNLIPLITGVANATAFAGKGASEFSRVMYNLNQSYGAGYLQLMDWKSVELAGVGSKQLKEAIIAAGESLGTIKKGKVTISNFAESLKDKWVTTAVMEKAFGQFSEFSEAVFEMVERGEAKNAAEAMEMLTGKYGTLGEKAFKAAQEAKSFTEAIEATKDAVSSGWLKTFEIIFGNYEESKALWTDLADFLWDVFASGGDKRNEILTDALGSKWNKLAEEIEKAGVSADDFTKVLEGVLTENGIDVANLVDEYGSLGRAMDKGQIKSEYLTKSLKRLLGIEEGLSGTTTAMGKSMEEYEAVVERVINGEFGHGKARWNKLTEQGYDWAKVQNMVNEKLGSTVRHTSTLTDEQLKNASSLAKLSDEQLKSKGYTEEQIIALRDLKKAAEEGGTSINDLIDAIEKPTGRELLIQSFKNIVEALVKPIQAIKDAWGNVFSPLDGDVLYTIIERFEKLTEAMIISDNAADNLQKVFEGLFAISQLGSKFINKSLTTALKLLKSVLGLFNLDLMDVVSIIADYLIKLRDWVEENTLLIGSMDKVAEIIHAVIEGIVRCVKAFMGLPQVQRVVENITKAIEKFVGGFDGVNTGAFDLLIVKIQKFFDKIEEWIKGLENSENIGKDLVEGIAIGIKNGVKYAVTAALNLAKTIFNTVCDFFGIKSPSRLFMAVGGYLIAGLVLGLQAATPNLWKSIGDICKKVVEMFSNIFKQITSGSKDGPSKIKAFFTKIVDVVKSILTNLVNFVKNIDFGSVIAIGLTAGMLLLVKKALDIVQTIADAAKGFSEIGKGIGSYLKSAGKAKEIEAEGKKFLLQAKGIRVIAMAIGIFAASLYLISKIEEKDIIRSGIVLGIMIAVLVAIFAALAILSSKAKNIDKMIVNIGAMSTFFLTLAGAMALMAIALRIVGGMDLDNAKPAIDLFIGLVVGISVLVAALGKFGSAKDAANLTKAGVLFLGISVAMLIMTTVIKRIAEMKQSDVERALGTIALLGALFVVIVVLSKFSGEFSKKAGSMLLKMAGAMLLMLVIIKIASKMDADTVLHGIAVVGLIGLLFKALITASSYAGKNAGKAGLLILGASMALIITAGAIKLLANLSTDELKKGLAVVTVLELLFMGLIAVTKYSGKHAAKVGIMLILMSAALLLVVGIMTLVSKMDPEGIGRGLLVISAMELLFMGLIRSMKYASKVDPKTILNLVIGIGVIAASLVVLSLIPADKLMPAVVALTTVMLAFAVLISTFSKTLTKAKATYAKDMSKPLWTLVGIVGILGIIVAALSFIPNPDNAIRASIAVGVLMASLIGALRVLGTGGSISKSVIEQLKPMVIVVGILSIIVAALSFIPNPMNAIPAATAISILLLSLSASLRILGTGGSVSKTVAAQIWPMVGVVVALGVVVGLLAALDIEPSIETAVSLSVLLLALSEACSIMAFIPVKVAAQAAAALGSFISIIGAFIAAFGALYKIPGCDKLLKDGGTVMQLIGDAIGKLIGGLVGGVLTGAGMSAIALIPIMGAAIALFMKTMEPVFKTLSELDWDVVKGAGIVSAALIALGIAGLVAEIGTVAGVGLLTVGLGILGFTQCIKPFLDYVRGLDTSVLDGVNTLCEAILMLTGAGLIDNLNRIFGDGDSSITKFAEELPALATAFRTFIDTFADVDDAAITKAENAAGALKKIAEATASIPNEGGLLGAFVGNNDPGEFGKDLENLGTGLVGFIDQIKDIDETAVTKAGYAGDALVKIATAAKEIPNDGGALGWLLGENNIGGFVSKLPDVGTHLKDFASNITGFSKKDAETVSYGADAVASIAKAANKIPNEGGKLGELLGDNSLSTFVSKLPDVGTNLVTFATNLGGLTEQQVTTIESGMNAISTIVTAASKIDGQTAVGKFLTGDNGIDTFSKKLPVVGTNLAKFTSNLGTFTAEQVSTVSSAVSAINAIATLSKSNLIQLSEHIVGMNEQIPKLGGAIKSFVTDMPGSDKINDAVGGLTTFMTNIKTINDDNVGAISTFSDSLKNLASEGVKSFVDAFSNDTAIGKATSAGETLVKGAMEGILNGESIAETNGQIVAGAAVTGLEDGYDDAKSAGKSVGSGFADGIEAKTDDVRIAAETLAASVPQWMRDILQINSPSKVIREIGKGVPEGFVSGIESFGGRVKDSAVSLASQAINGVKGTIATIAEAINSDVDAQPTIRPVLDLSDVKAGAGTINGLFADSSVGVMANVNSISSGMRGYNQNGSNDDVISAINDLKKAFSGTGDTYQINGVTYDDGSNIADAVKSLVRAAKVERRV